MKTLVGIIFLSLSIQTSSVLAHTEHGHPLKPEAEHGSSQLHEVEQLMEKAEQGDKAYFYTRAESLLDGITQPSRQARLFKAEILQYFHQFDAALQTLEKNKYDPATTLMRASIYFTQGKVKEAQQECKRLFGKVDHLRAITCMAQANSLRGELEKGYQVLKAAIQHIHSNDQPALAWASATLAEMAERKSDFVAAKSYYKKSLAIKANDHTSRIAYADILLAEKYYDEVLSLTKDYLDHDLLLLRYVRALNIQGDKRTNDHFCELKRRVLNYTDNNRHLHYDLLAEYYLYFSADYEQSLQWARRHWQQQKTPRDARLLASVAIKAADTKSLGEIQQWHTTYKIEDKSYEHLLKSSWLAMAH